MYGVVHSSALALWTPVSTECMFEIIAVNNLSQRKQPEDTLCKIGDFLDVRP